LTGRGGGVRLLHPTKESLDDRSAIQDTVTRGPQQQFFFVCVTRQDLNDKGPRQGKKRDRCRRERQAQRAEGTFGAQVRNAAVVASLGKQNPARSLTFSAKPTSRRHGTAPGPHEVGGIFVGRHGGGSGRARPELVGALRGGSFEGVGQQEEAYANDSKNGRARTQESRKRVQASVRGVGVHQAHLQRGYWPL
jgi:hypothetical protein